MSGATDKYVVNRTAAEVVRRCPFCSGYVKDRPGGDINFIIHLGKPTQKHLARREWADYLTIVNQASRLQTS